VEIKEIINSLKDEEFAVFCGAGISYNSGMPLVGGEYGMIRYILEKLSVIEGDINEIVNSNLPFEAFMEVLAENSDISKILDLFKQGEANTNHILMAKLAKAGILKTICTTNFDLLIEKALENEGLKKGKDFEVYCSEEQFSGVDFKNLNRISIFKIHGSADDEKSVRTTLKAVASKELSDKRMNVIRHVFSTGNHKKILALGYSCSDSFDIVPQVQSIDGSKKEIILIDHFSTSIEIKDIEKVDKLLNGNENPFKKFLGYWIKYDTDGFIKELWNSFEEIIEKYKRITSKTKWKTYIDNWGEEVDENKGRFIAGIMFYNISNFNKAIEYYEKSLKIRRDCGDRAGESKCYMNLGAAHGSLGDFNKEIEFYEKSLKIAKIGDRARESECYANLGAAYTNLGDFKKAIEYYEKSLKINKEIGGKSVESACYTGLGIVYRNLGDFNKAIEFNEKSLKIAMNIGNRAGESACYTNLGVVYADLGDSNKAIEFFEKSLKIFKKIGEKAGESIVCGNLADVYYKKRDYQKSLNYARDSIIISETIRESLIEEKLRELSMTFFKSKFGVYDLGVNAALKLYTDTKKQNYLKESFEIIEKTKSRELLKKLKIKETPPENIEDIKFDAVERFRKALKNKPNCTVLEMYQQSDRIIYLLLTKNKIKFFEQPINQELINLLEEYLTVSNYLFSCSKELDKKIIDELTPMAEYEYAYIIKLSDTLGIDEDELYEICTTPMTASEIDKLGEDYGIEEMNLVELLMTHTGQQMILSTHEIRSFDSQGFKRLVRALKIIEELNGIITGYNIKEKDADKLFWCIRENKPDREGIRAKYKIKDGDMEKLERLIVRRDDFLTKLLERKNYNKYEIISMMSKVSTFYDTLNELVTHILPEKLRTDLGTIKTDYLILLPHRWLHDISWEAAVINKKPFGLGYNIIRNYNIDLVTSTLDYKQHPFNNVLIVFNLYKPGSGKKTDKYGGLEEECIKVKNKLDVNGRTVNYLSKQQATLDNIKKELSDASLIHFHCHGNFSPGNPLEGSGINLYDCFLSAQDILSEEIEFKNHPLILLRGCKTGRTGTDDIGVMGDEQMGLVTSFFTAKASTLIVTGWGTYSEYGKEFSNHFYDSLLCGRNVAESLRNAREKIYGKYGKESRDWAAYMLYGNPFKFI